MYFTKVNHLYLAAVIVSLTSYATNAKADFYYSGVTYSENCEDSKATSVSFHGGQTDSLPVVKHTYAFKQGYKSSVFDKHVSRSNSKTAATNVDLTNNIASESYVFTKSGTLQLLNIREFTKTDDAVTTEALDISPVFSACKVDSVAAKIMIALVIANRKAHGESSDGLTDNAGYFEPSKIPKIIKSQLEEWKREEIEAKKQLALKAKEEAIRAKQAALDAAKNPKTYEIEKNMDSCKKIDGWTAASQEAVARKMESSIQAVSLLRGEWDAYTKLCTAIVDTAKGPKKFLIHRILTSDNGKTAFVVLGTFGNATFGW